VCELESFIRRSHSVLHEAQAARTCEEDRAKDHLAMIASQDSDIRRQTAQITDLEQQLAALQSAPVRSRRQSDRGAPVCSFDA
jgi:polyhydroxyalkanoate synthesis regulator phasin